MKSHSAFTLLELLIIIVVIAILVLLLLPAISAMRARAQRVQCTANLRSLYVAASADLQQKGSWPQIRLDDDSDTALQDYARKWIDELTPFGVTQKNWICPTIQNLEANPDLNKAENVRVDYIAMPFDEKPMTPYMTNPNSPTQRPPPWFIERGNGHETGNLIVFADGSVRDAQALSGSSPSPSANP